METVKFLIDFVLHIDKHLGELMIQHGPWWMYGIIFLIIFIETGLVFMPFLPGDSLLFASGALWAATGNNIFALLLLCIAAAVIGDNCNYFIGRNFSEYLNHGLKNLYLMRIFKMQRTLLLNMVGNLFS